MVTGGRVVHAQRTIVYAQVSGGRFLESGNSDMQGALVSTISLRPLLVELQRRGVDPQQLLEPRGIAAEDVTEPMTRVPESTLWEIWADAVQLTGDATLGVEVGCHFEPQSLGVLGHIIANSATIGDSVRKWQEFTGLIDDQPYIQLQILAETARLEFRRRPDIDPEDNRALVEFATFSALRLVGYLGGQFGAPDSRLKRLCFRHACPPEPQSQVYRSRVGAAELAFSQPANAIEMDAGLLKEPVVYADAQMLELMSERARQQLRNQHRGHFVVMRVQQAIRRRLAHAPTLPQVAADLSLSRSTLQRQLQVAGVSYRQLLDDIRCEHAMELLRDVSYPVESVAISLGYSEPAAFVYAFKRWKECTPSSWRASQGVK